MVSTVGCNRATNHAIMALQRTDPKLTIEAYRSSSIGLLITQVDSGMILRLQSNLVPSPIPIERHLRVEGTACIRALRASIRHHRTRTILLRPPSHTMPLHKFLRQWEKKTRKRLQARKEVLVTARSRSVSNSTASVSQRKDFVKTATVRIAAIRQQRERFVTRPSKIPVRRTRMHSNPASALKMLLRVTPLKVDTTWAAAVNVLNA